jgi:hypothetical protein
MAYAHIENGTVVEYPVYDGEIKLRYPNTSFTVPFVAPAEYASVKEVAAPTFTYTQNLIEGTPVLINDAWTQTWIVEPATDEQIAERTASKSDDVRSERNALLAQSDWTQLADSPLDPDGKGAWALYRETLRMVPQQPGFPWNVNWPPKPGA